jgi:tRNA(fMet)-specific endonuclease VapC
MNYLLDTNTCIRFLNGRSASIRSRFLSIPENQIHISVITQAEMFFGSYKSFLPEKSREKQKDFFKRFKISIFDETCADYYGQIRAYLEKQGTPIGSNDLLIAATALAHNMILVTHNTREFNRIPELQIEDWEV